MKLTTNNLLITIVFLIILSIGQILIGINSSLKIRKLKAELKCKEKENESLNRIIKIKDDFLCQGK